MRKKGRFQSGWFVFLAFVWLSSSAWAAEKLRWGTNTKTIPRYVLLFIAAEEKGFWKEQGLEAQWFPMEQSVQLYQAVTAGDIDMGSSAMSSTIFSASRGVPALLVADMQNWDRWYLWVRYESLLSQPLQLKGKRVGITRTGGLVHAMAATAVRALGLEHDIKLVATGGTAASVGALEAGAVDTVAFSQDAMARLVVERRAKPLVFIGDFLPKDWTEVSVMTRKGFWETRPEEVRKATKALVKAGSFISQNRDWAIGKMKTVAGYPEEAGGLIFDTLQFSKDGKIRPQTIQALTDFLVQNGLIPKAKAPRAEDLYVKEFAQ